LSRHFPIVTERRGPRTYRTCFLTCSVCGEQGDIGHQNFGADTADEQAPQKFRDRGWFVGRRPETDLCPKHAKRAKPPACEPVPEVVTTTEEPAMIDVNDLPTTADAPRTMSFIERRVILAKIEEVYIDEKTGYSSGWSDKKVATDLNVPLAWVAELREQNFGPAINEDFVGIMRELERLKEQFREHDLSAAKLITRHETELAELKGKAALIGDQMAALNARVKAAERAVLS